MKENSGLLKKAFLQGSWLAGFKLFGQAISWGTTILVARILVPDDYGLMTIATVFTGYGMLFSELGLGAAIIHRHEYTEDELNSVFWFGFSFSLLLGISCFSLAYPTSHVFNDDRIVPIVYAVSVLFVIGGLQIVPLNIIKKNLLFKKIGLIEISGTIVSCLSMIILAVMGAGVWTLIGGNIIRNITKLTFTYWIAGWYPKFHFNFEEVKPYLSFGLTVAFTRSVSYVNQKSDQFLAGMAWSSLTLGYYSFALQLARIPIDKLIGLVAQIAYPLFSKLKEDNQQTSHVYLKIVKVVATIIFPVYVGGFFLGDDLVKVVLGEKWLEIIFVFRWLCLSQIVVSLSSVNNFIHLANGRPHWNLYYNILLASSMAISFYFAIGYGFNWIVLPWMTTSNILSASWILVTITKVNISLYAYIKNILPQFVGTCLMVVGILYFENIILSFVDASTFPILKLVSSVVVGSFIYLSSIFFFDRSLFINIINGFPLFHVGTRKLTFPPNV